LFDFSGSYLTRTKQDDVGLHLSGPFQLAGRRHEAAFGAMHMKQTFNSDSRAADYGNVSSAVGDFNNWNGAAYPEPSWGAPTFYESSQTKQDSVYGVARFSLADPLKAIVGARVTNYEKTGYGLYTPAYTLKHDHEVTPYAGLVYDISRNYSVYASYTDIFQPQNLQGPGRQHPRPDRRQELRDRRQGRVLRRPPERIAGRLQDQAGRPGQAGGLVDRGTGPLARKPITVPTAPRAKASSSTCRANWRAAGTPPPATPSTAPRMRWRRRGQQHLPAPPAARVHHLPPAGRLERVTVGGGVNWEGRTWTIDPSAPGDHQRRPRAGRSTRWST
jgi:outer membrane receptor for ferric coprogen and ferric-rhodotorulic acid